LIRIGVIGYGYWGPNLVRNFAECPASEVAWTADVRQERLVPIERRYPGVVTTTDYRDLLKDPSVEAIVISTPISTHFDLASKGISAGKSQNSYRGLVRIGKGATNARNFSQCDSLLLGDKCGAHTFPYIEVRNNTAVVEHEATTSKIGEDQIFYCNQRGIDTETAVALIINGFAKEVMNQLPMEFAIEAQKLLAISLEGSVG